MSLTILISPKMPNTYYPSKYFCSLEPLYYTAVISQYPQNQFTPRHAQQASNLVDHQKQIAVLSVIVTVNRILLVNIFHATYMNATQSTFLRIHFLPYLSKNVILFQVIYEIQSALLLNRLSFQRFCNIKFVHALFNTTLYYMI